MSVAHMRTFGLAAAALLGAGIMSPASALVIELKDVAADRVERQRLNAEGALPLPGTPDISSLNERLMSAGITLASPIVVRIFKAESELEIWKEKSGAYFLFATYPICHWSGTLGPKLRTGDKQAPEGFYTVTKAQLHHSGRWPKSLNLGFPNVYDQSQARTGSDILIHGGCSSVGCYAMTNPVIDEIYQLTESALDAGEAHVPVQVFPFRMTAENMQAHADSPWISFWNNLKQGHDAFEQTKQQVKVNTCAGQYTFDASAHSGGPVEACEPTLTTIRDQDQWLNNVPEPTVALPKVEVVPSQRAQAQGAGQGGQNGTHDAGRAEAETQLGIARPVTITPPRAELQ